LDPERRCLRLEDWPEKDRTTWAFAIRSGGILDEAGAGAEWAPATVITREKAYGRYVNFLERTGRLDPEEPVADRVSPERIQPYVETLKRQVSSYTVWTTTCSLHAAVAAMAPDQDWAWLRVLVNRLHGQTRRSRPLTGRLVAPRVAFRAGLKLMDEAEKSPSLPSILRATRFRDGLMLALQAARPLRSKNLSTIEIGRHLVRHSGGYALRFERFETKNRKVLELSVPDALTVRIDRFIENYRPLLLRDRNCKALWITKEGDPMRSFSVYHRFEDLTLRLFGKRICPHMFRHGLATGIAIDDPEHVRMAADLLGHTTFATTDAHYVMARQLEASRRYRKLVDEKVGDSNDERKRQRRHRVASKRGG